MTSTTGTGRIVKKLADFQGILRDDIHVSDNTVTTYVPLYRLENAQDLEGIGVEVLEDHVHEYLISTKSKQ
jgi:hypothetical protein